MSTYSSYDFEESLDGIAIADVERVIAAWGWSSDGYASWRGGFLLALRDGRFAYISGWCDTSGWGCQDWRDVDYFDAQPELADLDLDANASDWDLDPIDLNRFVRGEIPSMDQP